MQFGLAFNYLFSRVGGFSNLLLITVCNLIPVVGPLVTLGYRSEVSVALLHDDEMQDHPKLDFNRFVEYLTRGLWPFVIQLIVGIVLIPIVVLGVVAGVSIAVAADQPLFLFAGYVFGIGLAIIVSLFAAPMTFHAELANKLDMGEAFRFTKSFWSLVGGQALITGAIFVPISFVVGVLGLLLCFVGIYPAAALLEMAAQHLMVQLYALYLERGGEPIPEYVEPRKKRRYEDEDEDEYESDDDEDDRPRRRNR